jgi:hypothetical protein
MGFERSEAEGAINGGPARLGEFEASRRFAKAIIGGQPITGEEQLRWRAAEETQTLRVSARIADRKKRFQQIRKLKRFANKTADLGSVRCA